MSQYFSSVLTNIKLVKTDRKPKLKDRETTNEMYMSKY